MGKNVKWAYEYSVPVDLKKVLWDSYDVAISMGMTDEDARVWALNKVTETSQQFVKEYTDE